MKIYFVTVGWKPNYEITFVKNYLDLEKLRHNEKFSNEIEISENVDQNWNIPKMVLQTYVENAVKHGLRYKETGGLLSIQIKKENKHLDLSIEDNGIGRKKAAEVSKGSTGKGLGIMEHYFALFNQYNDTKIKQKIIASPINGHPERSRRTVPCNKEFHH